MPTDNIRNSTHLDNTEVPPQLREHKLPGKDYSKTIAKVAIASAAIVALAGLAFALAAHGPDILADGANPISDLGMVAKLGGYGCFGVGLSGVVGGAIAHTAISRKKDRERTVILTQISPETITQKLDIYAIDEQLPGVEVVRSNELIIQKVHTNPDQLSKLKFILGASNFEVTLERDGKFNIYNEAGEAIPGFVNRAAGATSAEYLNRTHDWVTPSFEILLNHIATTVDVENIYLTTKWGKSAVFTRLPATPQESTSSSATRGSNPTQENLLEGYQKQQKQRENEGFLQSFFNKKIESPKAPSGKKRREREFKPQMPGQN